MSKKRVHITYKEFAESLKVLIDSNPHEKLGLLKARCWYNKLGEVRVYVNTMNGVNLGYVKVTQEGYVKGEVYESIDKYIANRLTTLYKVYTIERTHLHNTNEKYTDDKVCFICQSLLADITGLCVVCSSSQRK
jgi:hypothetical protein